MTQVDPAQVKVGAPRGSGRIAEFFRQHVLYIFILVLAISVAYTNMSHQPLVGYWEFLAVMMAAVCILTEWTNRENRHDQSFS